MTNAKINDKLQKTLTRIEDVITEIEAELKKAGHNFDFEQALKLLNTAWSAVDEASTWVKK